MHIQITNVYNYIDLKQKPQIQKIILYYKDKNWTINVIYCVVI